MAIVNAAEVQMTVELLEKRFAKEKIAKKLNAVLKSQKKRTEELIEEVRKFAQESGQKPDQLVLVEFQLRINLMVYAINGAISILLNNENEDSLDDLILCMLTEENARLNVEAYEKKLQSMKSEYELFINQERFNEMCEQCNEYPNDIYFGYLS